MRTITRDDGFTLTELLVSTTITLMVLAGAMTTVKNALTINDTGTQLSDANQNLRAGTNLLIKDLMQAGRSITVGGIPIPSGTGSTPLNRPSPPGLVYTFDNTTATTLPAIYDGLRPRTERRQPVDRHHHDADDRSLRLRERPRRRDCVRRLERPAGRDVALDHWVQRGGALRQRGGQQGGRHLLVQLGQRRDPDGDAHRHEPRVLRRERLVQLQPDHRSGRHADAAQGRRRRSRR